MSLLVCFKQKTAYEIRISDWSSDVCSSDLGARVSLLVGLISTLAALAIGVPLGAVAGYAGGRVDDALMRFTEFFQTIPSFALALVLVAILQPSMLPTVTAIAIDSRPPVARLELGRTLWRERGWQDVYHWGVASSLTQKTITP